MEEIKQQQLDILEGLSGISKDKAKEMVMAKVKEAMSLEIAEYIKERQKANEKLYNFSASEEDIFAAIERSLPEMKKYCKKTYNILNKNFAEELEAQYANIGMLNGQFWVREEGSSGSSSNEQVRIIEQMTDKLYHVEKDIEAAAQQIKKGEGSGIISYSVDDKSYAFHAQYAPSVTTETVTSPITGEKSEEEMRIMLIQTSSYQHCCFRENE